MTQALELIPNQKEDTKPKPLFATSAEFQVFCLNFENTVKADLKKLQEARLNSEEEAKRHWLY
jgi:hypothetical protein